ncbi:hypothetical protein VTN96DRAFT_9280 [Rasamsonia emersonii]
MKRLHEFVEYCLHLYQPCQVVSTGSANNAKTFPASRRYTGTQALSGREWAWVREPVLRSVDFTKCMADDTDMCRLSTDGSVFSSIISPGPQSDYCCDSAASLALLAPQGYKAYDCAIH